MGIVLQDSVPLVARSGQYRFGVLDVSQKWSKRSRVRHIFMTISKVYQTNMIPWWMMIRISFNWAEQLFPLLELLTDPQVLIFGRGDVNVDTVTESKIQQAMEAIVAGRTSLSLPIASRRFSMLTRYRPKMER